MKHKLDLKLVLIFLAVSLFISAPFIYRLFEIRELYLNPEARKAALDSVFFLREQYGLTIADLSIYRIKAEPDSYIITVHEYYHGFIDRSKYDDLDRNYVVIYDRKQESFAVEKIVDIQ